MATSKNRLTWPNMPESTKAEIEEFLGGSVVAAENCPGGFSPGFASKLTLDTGRHIFLKAMDTVAWPTQGAAYRDEITVASALPREIPAPQFLGFLDTDHLVALAFECIPGHTPAQPWVLPELRRVAAAVSELSQALTPSPVKLPSDHPRLGGWASIDACGQRRELAAHSPWAADRLPMLIEMEMEGLTAARGTTLVHFDLYAHNVLLTADRVLIVDWPHARLGAPVIDLVMTLASAAADGIDPEQVLRAQPIAQDIDRHVVDVILVAHAGFCTFGALEVPPPGLEPIIRAKQHLSYGALTWLQRRLGSV